MGWKNSAYQHNMMVSPCVLHDVSIVVAQVKEGRCIIGILLGSLEGKGVCTSTQILFPMHNFNLDMGININEGLSKVFDRLAVQSQC